MFNKLLNVFFRSYFYRKLFLNKKFNLFESSIDLSIFDSINYTGYSILYDEIDVFGKKYTIKEFLNIKILSPAVLEYLHSFFWLSNLKALSTPQASIKAYSLIDAWSSKFKNFNAVVYNEEILAERVFHLTTYGAFVIKDKDDIQKAKIKAIVNANVNHLINLYSLHKFKLYKMKNKLKISKALLAVIFSSKPAYLNKKHIVEKLIKNVELDIKENIFNDGGHISRNPSLALAYLENLLQVYYIIKDKDGYNIDFIRTTIDRISLFIRSMRHPDGRLAIFNGGYESTKIKIDYLLALSNVSTKPSMVLRDSGYTKLIAANTSIIFDVGARVKNNNSLLSCELVINNKKIITNLGNNIFDVNYPFLNNEQMARMYNSCLVLKINNRILSFDLNESNLKIERRYEDNWDIIKFVYTGFKNLGITYYRTIYVSKKDYTCILGEDMISLEKKSETIIQEAFLRFHLSPEIKSVELYKKSKVVLFPLDGHRYILSSSDNKVNLSKNIYSAIEGELINCYTIDIPFNLNNKIIKNEWSIAMEDDMKKFSAMRDTVRILTVVDMQNSFLKENGRLSVKNASSLISKANNFFNALDNNFFEAIIFTQDTHFANEYKNSQEAESFPLHCEFNTEDWQMALNMESFKEKPQVYKLYKNKFDMWGSEINRNNNIGLDFKNYSVYKNLYKILDINDDVIFESMEDFLLTYKNKKVEIYIMGVASDYCVKYAIDGYLKKGFNVAIIQDLTCGINKEIIDVIKDDYAKGSDLLNIKLVKASNL
ncbi:MAG: isochorismatase family protein [Alphaproteobacteria bacterium]|nr:isochorismatase family protein [Alphaproteobacteria bacterium]